MKVGDLVKLTDIFVAKIYPNRGIGVVTGVGMDQYGEEIIEVYWASLQKTMLVSNHTIGLV